LLEWLNVILRGGVWVVNVNVNVLIMVALWNGADHYILILWLWPPSVSDAVIIIFSSFSSYGHPM